MFFISSEIFEVIDALKSEEFLQKKITLHGCVHLMNGLRKCLFRVVTPMHA